jgi:hypothetical protein
LSAIGSRRVEREFFTASTGASATLLELLSIAIAVEPKSIVGEQSPVESRSRASSAYTALINIFFISLLGDHTDLGSGVLAIDPSNRGTGQHARYRREPVEGVPPPAERFKLGGRTLARQYGRLRPGTLDEEHKENRAGDDPE